MLEILAPCGGIDTIDTALQNGADAVYLGISEFSARRNAKNFTFDELAESVRKCHLAQVKVYLALNTVIFDDEMKAAQAAIAKAVECGIDGIILQDLSVMSYVKSNFPKLPLHASTQMSVTSTAGAQALKKLGFSRVVLARELPSTVIADIAKNVDIQLEVFVHGALCVCISGQCYMSSVIGGRSGNRGLCAQPCRLNYHSGEREHILSLKDLSIIEEIPLLEKLGISSIKIEGRMKRPEYVAAAVNACYEARSGGKPNTELLRGVFSRSGFTKGYFNADLSNMQGIRTKEDVLSFKDAGAEIRELPKHEKKHPVDIEVVIAASEKARCIFRVGDITVQSVGELPQPAHNTSLTAETVEKQFSKLGGTVFEAAQVNVQVEDGLFLSASCLNQMRRTAVSLLERELLANF